MKCKFCYQDFDPKVRAEIVYKSKVKNALASTYKRKLSGKHGGRPKQRDDIEIKRLRARGLTIRQIAKEVGFSTTAVMRGLK